MKIACNPKDVKSLFSNENVYVSFGHFLRDFKYDNYDKNRPIVKGTVIAGGSVFRRGGRDEGIIYFYVIKDLNYNTKKKEIFTRQYLQFLFKWYQETIKIETLSGVEKCLIELYDNDFKTHCYRYH